MYLVCSVLWARTGLFNWWALILLAFKDQPFMLVSLLIFPAPTEHLFLHHPCSNPVFFVRDGVPMCRKLWQIHWAESHPLKPIPSSVLAFPQLPSSLLQLLCLNSAWPGCASAHTHGSQLHPRLILLLKTKQNLQGAGVKRAFSLLKVSAHL